jgi:hypothetical protein
LVQIANRGRTPAVIFQATTELALVNSLPKTPTYRNIIDFDYGEVVVLPRDSWLAPESWLRELTDDDVTAIYREEKTVWLYGFVAFWDVLYCENRVAYCARWYPKARGGEGRFVQWEAEGYAYSYRDPTPGNATRVPPILTALPPKR